LPVRTAATEEDLAVLEAWYAHLDDMASLHTIELLIEAIAGLQIAIAVAAHNPLQAALERTFVELLLNLQMRPMRPRGLRSWQVGRDPTAAPVTPGMPAALVETRLQLPIYGSR
jgi:hypothetical protein